MDIIPPSTMKTEEFRAVLSTVDMLEDHFLDPCGCIPGVSTITATVALTVGIVGTICCIAVQIFQAIASYSGVSTLLGVRIVMLKSDVENLQYRFLNTLIKGCVEVAPFVGNIGVYVLVQDEIAQKKMLFEHNRLETDLKRTSEDLHAEKSHHIAYLQAESEKMRSFLETLDKTKVKVDLLDHKCKQLTQVFEEIATQKSEDIPLLGLESVVGTNSPPQGAVERYDQSFSLQDLPPSQDLSTEDLVEMSVGESVSSVGSPLATQEVADLQHTLGETQSQLADQMHKGEVLRRENEALRLQLNKERTETLLVLHATQNMISRQDLEEIQARMATHRRNSTRSHDPKTIR